MQDVKIINSNEIRVIDLPEPNVNWYQFCLFALSWDPRVELGDDQFPPWALDINHNPDDDSTILEIRCYLYLQQRWWNNKTEDIDDGSFRKIHQAIELLRKKLQTK